MTQNEMIYDYLKKNGSIATYQAFAELFITRLSARIFDIKKLYGVKLKEEWIIKKNVYGKTCSFKKYILEDE